MGRMSLLSGVVQLTRVLVASIRDISSGRVEKHELIAAVVRAASAHLLRPILAEKSKLKGKRAWRVPDPKAGLCMVRRSDRQR